LVEWVSTGNLEWTFTNHAEQRHIDRDESKGETSTRVAEDGV